MILVVTSGLIVSLPGAFDTGPVWPDGNQYTFNGILIHDMVRDGGVLSPYRYAVDFYIKYPATNLPYGPPFFAAVFAFAFSIFGVSFSVARCVIAVYTSLAALICFCLVSREMKSNWYALFAVSAFLLNPLTGIYARDITPEIPVAFFSFLTIYFFFNFVEYEKKYYGILTALSLGLGYLTKPYIIPLGISLAVYIIVYRKWSVFWKIESYITISLFAFLVAPQTFLAYKYTFNELGHMGIRPIAGLGLLPAYANYSISHLPIITLVALIGFIVAFFKKERLVLFCLLWALCSYVFFVFCISVPPNSKYFYSISVSIIIPFAAGSYFIIKSLKKWRIDIVVSGLLIGWFIYSALSTPVYFVHGYEAAGNFVAKDPHGQSVLYYGGYGGSFMMGLRRSLPKEGPYVLRGDRKLAVRVSYGDAKKDNVDIVKAKSDIIDIVKQYHIGYIIIEKDYPWAKHFPEYKLLLKTMNSSDLFREIKRFPIKSNYCQLGHELIIYKTQLEFSSINRENKITVPVPTLKKVLEKEINE